MSSSSEYDKEAHHHAAGVASSGTGNTSASEFAHDAALATTAEKNLTLMQGLRAYPKACAWSMLISSCIIMEGYDVVLINGLCEYFGPRRGEAMASESKRQPVRNSRRQGDGPVYWLGF